MSRQAVLAICTTAMGDTLLATPALTALGENFDLDVLVHQHRLPLLAHFPHIRDLFPYRNNPIFRIYLASRLARRHYHRLLVMHANDDIQRLLPFLRYELAGNLQGWDMPRLKVTCLHLPDEMHVVDKRLRLATWAGAPEGDFPIRINILAQEAADAESWLNQNGLLAENPRVAMVPGAANLFKRWPAERFAKVILELKKNNVAAFLIGTGQEKDIMSRIDREVGETVPRLVDVGLRDLAAAISRSDLLLTNDTGPLHLGQAVDTPVLALFGPTDPITIGPRAAYHRVVKVPPLHNPCLTKKCKKAECMRQVDLETVIDAAQEMLARPCRRTSLGGAV